MIKDTLVSSSFLLLAIILGLVSGLYVESAALLTDYVDYVLLALLALVLFDISFDKIKDTLKQPKILLITWVSNFLILPVLGYGIAQLFFPNQPLIALGLAIYFMAPCTDWFLGFIRMADGNTAVGSVLIPINMLTQLLLYPFMLQWFSQGSIASISAGDIFSTMTNWFVVPVVAAVVLRVLTMKLPSVREGISAWTNYVLYALVFMVFAVNVQQITQHANLFVMIFLAAAVFFGVSTLFTEIIAKATKLSYDNRVLYSITTTARNSPMMLGLTMVALPNQPLIYAAIIMGMLIEFPFLTLQVARFKLFYQTHSKKDEHSAQHVSSQNHELSSSHAPAHTASSAKSL